MCHFFSFVITKDGRFLTGNGYSHSGIEKGWNLKPDFYREAEWANEDPHCLEVRGINNADSNWYKAAVLSKFRTRSELLASITEGRTIDAVYKLKNGKQHREDGPAVEWADGSKEWWVDGLRHREDGPAIEYASGHKEWYLNGKLHREDGPAVECASGSKFWFLNDKELTEEEFLRQMEKSTSSCHNKIVEINGKKYRLTEV